MGLPTPHAIRTRRTELGLTQREVANRAGVSQAHIARIERGDVDPRRSTLQRIVDLLEAAADDVVCAEDVKHEEVVSVGPDAPVRKAVTTMEANDFFQLPVIDDGVPVGAISVKELLRVDEDVRDHPVREVMGESFPTKSRTATLEELNTDLQHHKGVLITDHGTPVGIVTEADIAARVA